MSDDLEDDELEMNDSETSESSQSANIASPVAQSSSENESTSATQEPQDSKTLSDNGARFPHIHKGTSSSIDTASVTDAHAPRVTRSVSNQPINPRKTYVPAQPEQVSAPVSSQQQSAKRGKPRARRMSLSLTHMDAWSVAKVTFLLGVAGAIIQIVAATLIWTLLNVVGVFDQLTQIVSSTGLDASGFNLSDVFSLSTILNGVTIFSIVEVVLITILATIITWLYNVVSALVGGVHVTLGDD